MTYFPPSRLPSAVGEFVPGHVTITPTRATLLVLAVEHLISGIAAGYIVEDCCPGDDANTRAVLAECRRLLEDLRSLVASGARPC